MNFDFHRFVPNWLFTINGKWQPFGRKIWDLTLSEAVIILNREMEELAVKQDFTTLEKLNFVKQQIMEHTCRKSKK